MMKNLVYFSSEALAILSASHSKEHKRQLICHLFNMGAVSSVLQVSEDKCCEKYLTQEWLSVAYNAQNYFVDRCIRLRYVTRYWKLKMDVIS